MLTDRPDVPRTPFGRVKPPNGVYWGDIRTRLQFKRKFVRVLCDTTIHNVLVFLRLRSPSAVRGQFKDIVMTFQPKNLFLRLISDNVWLVALKMVTSVVPALGDPRRERTPAMYGHVINVPTHFNVKLPAIGGHLPNADADSHLLVVRTCYNGQLKQMPRFRRSFQPKIARRRRAP